MMSCHFKCDKLSHTHHITFIQGVLVIYYTVLWYAYKEPYRYFTHQNSFFAFSPSQVCTDKGCISFWYVNDSANLPVVVFAQMQLESTYESSIFRLIPGRSFSVDRQVNELPFGERLIEHLTSNMPCC